MVFQIIAKVGSGLASAGRAVGGGLAKVGRGIGSRLTRASSKGVGKVGPKAALASSAGAATGGVGFNQQFRLRRVQELKRSDPTMTSTRALEIIRNEEASVREAMAGQRRNVNMEIRNPQQTGGRGSYGNATPELDRAISRMLAPAGRYMRDSSGPEQDAAAKSERGAAGAERKAAKSEQSAAEEERRAAKAEESFLKKLLNKNVSGGGEGTAASGASWVSIALIIIGLAEYLLRISTAEMSGFVYALSLLLFLLSGLAVAHFAQKDKITILVPMLLFVVWYFFFNGNYNPGFLMYFIPIAIGILAIPMVFSKGESIAPELVGFVPVLFFFLDIGLIPFLVENLKLPVTPLLQNLILFMPWWVLLGIFTFPGGASKSSSVNALLGFLRIMGIIYIMFIVLAPVIPGLGYEKSLLPEAGEFEAAQQRLRAGIPQRENPAWSNLACIFSDPTNVQRCVEQRQENSELTYICEKIEKKEKGTPQFTQCMEEQKKKKKDAALQVQGAIDPTIKEPTKAEIIASKESFPTTYNSQFPFPFELKIENPRTLPLSLELTCNFEGKSGAISRGGRIEGAPPAGFIFRDAEFKSGYLCFPEGELKGNYKAWFNATIKDLVTESRLQRAFVGDKSAEEIDRLRREEISKVIRTPESLAPADFAHINFDLGHAAKEAVIENKAYKTIVLKGNIENTGPGKIVAVKNYEIPLESEGFSIQQNQVDGGNTCVQGNFPVVQTTLYSKNIPLPTCIIADLPPELKTTSDWVPKTFTATLKYDYRISKEIDIDIKPAEEAVGQ